MVILCPFLIKFMKIFSQINEVRHYLKAQYPAKIGFVPTMGALHAGHLALLERAKAENEIAVCSIFVNPIQFNNAQDLQHYPRPFEQDIALLEQVGCDVLFAPSETEMYPQTPLISVQVGSLGEVMEGKYRAGHFNGVGVVVSKFFNIIRPHVAYFGQKDLQQCAIVRRIVEDMSIDLELKICSTVRETDGLAMSSRNLRLETAERQKAPLLYQALQTAEKIIRQEQNLPKAQAEAIRLIEQEAAFRLEYFEIVDLRSLENVQEMTATLQEKPLAICVAAYLGKVRLIDNVVLEN